MKKSTLLKLSLSLGLFTPALSLAAPGTLSDEPLTFVVAPTPNIMLLLDDSASMAAAQVISEPAQIAHSVDVDGSGDAVSNFSSLDSSTDLLETCVGYNQLAYDPSVNYEPWVSISSDTTTDQLYTYTNKTLETARRSPVNHDGTNTLELGSPRDLTNPEYMYLRWDDEIQSGDTELNGKYDVGECGPTDVSHYDGVPNPHNLGTDTDTGNPATNTVVDETEGVFYDSGGPNAQYAPSEDFTFTIDVAGLNSNDGTLTIFLEYFRLDYTDHSPGGLDSLTVYTGIDTGATNNFVSVLDAGGEAESVTGPSLELNAQNADTFNIVSHERIRTLVISGSEAHFVFDSTGTGDGFIITWQHSTGKTPSNSSVTADECTGHCVRVSDLPDDENDTSAPAYDANFPYNTKQNYANWYTYYRTRINVAKQALGKLVSESDYRVGLALANGVGSLGGAPVKPMLAVSNEQTDIDAAQANKDELLKKIYSAKADGNSHLRTLLNNAGLYFQEGQNPPDTFFGVGVENIHNNDTAEATDEDGTIDDSPMFSDTGQCQQNFSFLFTDGAWDDITAPANIGNQDLDLTSAAGIASDYTDSYSDTLADIAMKYFETDLSPTTLANDLDVELHEVTKDEQHMVTSAVGFGVSGTLNDSDGNPLIPTDVSVTWTDPEVTRLVTADPQIALHRMDDLLHASFNGRGQYFSATNTSSLQSGLDDLVKEINARLNNTEAGVALSSYELATGSLRFDVTYSPDGWWGDLQAYKYENGSFKETPEWSASDELSIADRENQRQIITFNGSQGVAFTAPTNPSSLVSSGNQATISQKQVDDLFVRIPGVLAEQSLANKTTYLEKAINYIRGDDANESDVPVSSSVADLTFYNRDGNYLGALIHSQPVYVGEPNAYYPNEIEGATNKYQDFVADWKDRPPIVYVGGNDGMLHGFYAESGTDDSGNTFTAGEELFAYIPEIISDADVGGNGLNNLLNESANVTPYVDGFITVGDVFVDKASDTTDRWRTYLVGALRAGGRGIYVLDVTNSGVSGAPNASSYPRLDDAETQADEIVVREFTHPDLGYVYGRPKIAKMNNGRWAAIVANGYINDNENGYSGDGTAKLFIIYLDKEGGYTILDGSEHSFTGTKSSSCTPPVDINDTNTCSAGYGQATYSEDGGSGTVTRGAYFNVPFSCQTGTGGFDVVTGYTIQSCASTTDWNGLSSAAVYDTNADGKIDRVYGGDLHGNLWSFDISTPVTLSLVSNDIDYEYEITDWKVDDNDTTRNEPIFVACRANLQSGYCPENDREPITTEPIVRGHPYHISDATAPNILLFFGTGQYLNDNDRSDTSAQHFYTVWDAGESNRFLTKSDLQFQELENNNNSIYRTIKNGGTGFTYSTTGVDPLYGWYMNLPSDKERVVLRAVQIGHIVIFVSFAPNQGNCGVTAGTSYIMITNALTGTVTSANFFGSTAVVDGQTASGQQIEGAIVSFGVTKDGDSIDILTQDAGGEGDTIRLGGDNDSSISNFGNGLKSKGRTSWSILK